MPRRDRGESLIELLVTITILGIAVVAILSSIEATVRSSAQQKNEAALQSLASTVAENVQALPYSGGCTPYDLTALPAPVISTLTGTFYTVSPTANGSDSSYGGFRISQGVITTLSGTCLTATTQTIPLTITTPDGGESTTVTIVKRNRS